MAPISALGLSLSFNVSEPSAIENTLNRFASVFPLEWGTVGIGSPLIQALGVDISGLSAFETIKGPNFAAPASQAALWLFLRADNKSMLFDRAEQAKLILRPAFSVSDAKETFKYRDGRDLTGYEDGTENPQSGQAISAAVVGKPNQLAGSSFVAVQRWVHNLPIFHQYSPHERDQMMGRRLEDNVELDDAPQSSHVKRSAQESFNPEAFMLRRSMPWSDSEGCGLEFVAFANSLSPFKQIMNRMLGLEDGINDALFRFSKPITGGYYWCPPVSSGRLDLSLLISHK